uniref:mRNA (2'-O-methyladenosine-N(6)-)-methyltransferase n=1 Tax=Pyxicephalus adspersus TaxID=30357 RepID=A0AAV3ATL2_PYXAD|nr:TPA: hypothetical protein GDO54_008272 [Pyxicephalus adspersus]
MARDNHGSPQEDAALISLSPSTSSSPRPSRPVSDLPDELIQAGWEKCWSKRESRPYYFNRFTNQSLWEMPVLGQHDVISDPLGLNAAPVPAEACVPTTPKDSMPRKRRISEEAPVTESTKKLKRGIDPPRESFNRWLLERKVLDRGPDPLLPSDCDPAVSPSMFREIMNDVPIRLSRIKHRDEAKRLLFKYAEAAKRLIESRRASPDIRKVVKWNVEDTFNWLRRDNLATKEDYMDRLEHLRRQCGPHMAAVARDSVEGICSKIYHFSQDYVKRIREKHMSLLREANIPEPNPAAPCPDKMVFCHPVRLISPALPFQGGVDVQQDGSLVCVRYKGESVRINQSYFSKLFQLYRLSSTDDPGLEKFLSRVWSLLRRYQVMFGTAQFEGSGLQGALPVSVFQALHRIFGVTLECFASPLNCYFKQYCSAFPDTDGYFGSRGPCLSFFPVSGSFEANPPFSEELMDAMVTHFEYLLESSDQPLSFIVFIPEWRDPPTPALTRMEESRFKRHQMVLPAFQHEYRSGSQHVCKREELYYKAVHNTAVLFLQNEAGFQKWTPSPERVQELCTAYKHSSRPSSGGTEKESPREEGTSKDSMNN